MAKVTQGPFELFLSSEAKDQIAAILESASKAGLQKQLKKALNHLVQNPHHPGLHSHPISQFDEIFGGKVFSSYVQNNTPRAYRILWLYGPGPKQVTIVSVIPHY